MDFQQLAPNDAAAFQRLRLFALQECPTAFGSSYVEEVDRPLEVVVERLEDANNYIFGVFLNDRRLIGMAVLHREQRVTRYHTAQLFSMYVLPENRRKGVGRALLDAALSRAKELGVRQVNLSVVNGNKTAILLYESCGFERYGLEKDAFKIGNDFYDLAYMALRLKGDGTE